MMTGFPRATALIAMTVWISTGGDACTQIRPEGVVRIVVPFTAGSPPDVMARLIGDQLSPRLRQPVVIENRPGGGGMIGARAVASAVPDGNTLLFISSSLVIDPVLYRVTNYNPITSFAPVAAVASVATVMVVSSTVPARSILELIAYAKAHPGELNFGFAMGTPSQLVGELFKILTGTDITSIPYRGGSGVVPDMLGGRVHIYFGTTATILPLIREGKLRPLAITSSTRSPLLPDVPTMIESGLPELSLNLWMGVLAPASTPARRVNTLNSEINESLQSLKLTSAMRELGFKIMIGTPQEFAAFITEEAPKWAAIIKASGAKVD